MIKILEKINKITLNEANIHSVLVYVFVKKNNLKNISNNHIKKIINLNNELLILGNEIVNDLGNSNFGFEELIYEFEKIIGNEEKVTNGVVYTPKNIREHIIKESLKKYTGNINDAKCIDISCGCGNFLFSLSSILKKKTKKSYKNIFIDNIFGIDILAAGIERTILLLELLAIYNGEDELNFSFNLNVGNSLSKDFLNKFENKLDIVIGNPPYVRSKNLSKESKVLMREWSVSSVGNLDLYIPFFQIGLLYLKKEGILGYITVNSFFKSVNARGLRNYISDNKFCFDIVDFGGQQIFDNNSTYTCLCFITNKERKYLQYKKITNLDFNNKDINFNKLNYNILDNKNGWILNNNENITKIENTGIKLGDLYSIKNGIATLKNDIYIFKPISENKKYYTFNKDGKEYKIEKEICRDIVKPNTLKITNLLKNQIQKAIFPYYINNGVIIDIEEKEFKLKYKNTYKYLSDYKDILFNREKGGGKDFKPWYKYGRNQALLDTGNKILLPYIAGKYDFHITENKDLLLYCGYAIYGNCIDELKVIKKIIASSIFSYYISNTSKPYTGGYYSTAKNHIKNFGICELSKEDKIFLVKEKNKINIDNFLIKKYNLEGINV